MAADIPPPEVPVVVLSGGNQPAAHLAAHRALAESSRHGRHIVVERSAHWVQFDTPELVVSTVRELVESSRTALRGRLAPATS
jgi:pimeloyl-ACP methyl ester carboxylesterase